MIGSTVAHFRLAGPFGGDTGLYRAVDSAAHGRPVLLLVLVPERPGPEEAERFRRAALAASALGHPAIAPVEDLGEADNGRLFVALSSVEGETLEDRLARGPLQAAEALALTLQLADALAAALGAGIVHGDLRPSRVLLTSAGPSIVAFGLGEIAAPGSGAEEGASFYRAPERLSGEPPGPRSDVWSLGVLLYEMVSGRPPFRGTDESERAAAVATVPPDPLPAPLRGIEGVLLKALRKRPQERWRDAAEMAAALRALPGAASTGSELAPTVVDIPVQPGGSGRRALGGLAPADLPAGLTGRDVENYRLGERLGSGGMAVVFRAEDLRLGRQVALKFLAPELSRDPVAKQRFLREARAASALDHPNLCTIHEVGETEDGQIFLAMPCYEGETLRDRIRRGPLTLEDAVEIAAQVAQGLGKAHRNGIVHRDIKPANLMITTDGVVKVLDFGLAKLAGTTGVARKETGGGTLAYMSPEQTRGDDVDGRADLWSLGVVLYEMLTGQKPFRADREQAVLFAIRTTAPEPLATVRPDVPAALERIVQRLLAKNPDDRFPTAETVVAELRQLLSPTLSGVPSVLPAPPASGRRWGLRAAAVVSAARRRADRRDRPRAPPGGRRLRPNGGELHAAHLRGRARDLPERGAGRRVLRLRQGIRGRPGHLLATHRRGQSAEPDCGLPLAGHPTRRLARRRADRLPLRARRGRALPHGSDRRIGAPAHQRRVQPRLVARRPGARLRDRRSRRTREPGDHQPALARGRGDHPDPAAGHPWGRRAAELVAA